MSLRYFEGFDVHTKITGHGGLIVADTDAWHNWRTGTLSYWRPAFPKGYLGGRSMWVSEYIGGANQASVSGMSEFRMGFWMTAARLTSGIRVPKMFFRFYPEVGGGSFGVFAENDGSFTLRNGSSIVEGPTAPLLEDDAMNDPPVYWAYYEIYYNGTTGELTIERNGIEVLGTDTFAFGVLEKFEFGHVPAELSFPVWEPIVDHLWITDGEKLTGTEDEILGVVINAAQDSFTSNGRGFRGTMVMSDGNRYTTDWERSATYSGGQWDHNICTVTPFFFFKDPRDNSDWTERKLDEIYSWGVCFAPTDAAPGDKARLDSMALSYLTYNYGRPLVKYEIPGSLAYFSGNWEKTDEDLALFAHVNDVPREDILMAVDSKSLYIGELGCLLFNRSRGRAPDDIPDYPLEDFGVTFAEEYREDYRDFVKVDGVGTDYLSYAVSGYNVLGEGNRKFQNNYITLNYRTVPNGQAYVQGLWDYAEDPDTGRWSMKQLVYFLDKDGHKHASRKVKIRGHGKALQIRIESQSGKPFEINGWTLYVTANQHP